MPHTSVMQVAPITGAWIETAMTWVSGNPLLVAPITGAWIETALAGKSVFQSIQRRAHHGRVE